MRSAHSRKRCSNSAPNDAGRGGVYGTSTRHGSDNGPDAAEESELSAVMTKAPKKATLTDVERHQRFLDMAEKVGASESAEAFDAALNTVVRHNPKKSNETENRVPSKG